MEDDEILARARALIQAGKELPPYLRAFVEKGSKPRGRPPATDWELLRRAARDFEIASAVRNEIDLDRLTRVNPPKKSRIPRPVVEEDGRRLSQPEAEVVADIAAGRAKRRLLELKAADYGEHPDFKPARTKREIYEVIAQRYSRKRSMKWRTVRNIYLKHKDDL